jgi:hypothetical protein
LVALEIARPLPLQTFKAEVFLIWRVPLLARPNPVRHKICALSDSVVGKIPI